VFDSQEQKSSATPKLEIEMTEEEKEMNR